MLVKRESHLTVVVAVAAGVVSFLFALCETLCFLTFSATGLAASVAEGVAAGAVGAAAGVAAKLAAAKPAVMSRATIFFMKYLSEVVEQFLQRFGVTIQRAVLTGR